MIQAESLYVLLTGDRRPERVRWFVTPKIPRTILHFGEKNKKLPRGNYNDYEYLPAIYVIQ